MWSNSKNFEAHVEIVLDGETVYLPNYHEHGIQTIELVKKEINKIISK